MTTMQTIETTFSRPNGQAVRLRAEADADGVMSGPWEARDDAGQRVTLDGHERWWAVNALHREIERRRAN